MKTEDKNKSVYITNVTETFIKATPKLQQVISLMLRHLQTDMKRRGDATPW